MHSFDVACSLSCRWLLAALQRVAKGRKLRWVASSYGELSRCGLVWDGSGSIGARWGRGRAREAQEGARFHVLRSFSYRRPPAALWGVAKGQCHRWVAS